MNIKMLIVLVIVSFSSIAHSKTAVIGFQLESCTREATTNLEIDGAIYGNRFRFEKIVSQISGIDYKTMKAVGNGDYCGAPSAKTYYWTFFDTSDVNIEKILQQYDGKDYETNAGSIHLYAKVVDISANISVIFTRPSAKLNPVNTKFSSLKELWSVYSSPFPANRVSDVCISTMKKHLLNFSPSIESSINDFFKTWRGPGQYIGWEWNISFIDENAKKMPFDITQSFADYWVMWGEDCTQTSNGYPNF